jgi:hypothetical protein
MVTFRNEDPKRPGNCIFMDGCGENYYCQGYSLIVIKLRGTWQGPSVQSPLSVSVFFLFLKPGKDPSETGIL